MAARLIAGATRVGSAVSKKTIFPAVLHRSFAAVPLTRDKLVHVTFSNNAGASFGTCAQKWC